MADLFKHDNSNLEGIRNLKELLDFAHKKGYDVDFQKKQIDLPFYQKEIDLIAFAEDCHDLDFNYKILKEKSSNRSYSLRPDPEKGGAEKFDRIVVSQNNRGMYKYWNLDEKDDKGTIIDFIQNRLKLPKKDFKTPIQVFQKFVFGNTYFQQKHKIHKSDFSSNSAVNLTFKPRPLTDFSYLESRGLSQSAIRDFPFINNIFQSNVNNLGQAVNKTFTLFPIRTKFGGFSSFIFKGPDVSKRESILKDSSRSVGLWMSNIHYDVDEKDINVLNFKSPAAEHKYPEDIIDYINDSYQNKLVDLDFMKQKISVVNDSFSENVDYLNTGIKSGDLVINSTKSITRTPKPVDNIFITEAPIDAISYHQMYKLDSKENNVYIATAGSISPTQYQLMNETIIRLKPKNICPIFDNDPAGRKYDMAFLSNLNIPEYFYSGNDPVKYDHDFDTINKSLHSLSFTPNYVEKNNPTLQFSAFIDNENMRELRSTIFDHFKNSFSSIGLDVSDNFNYNFRDKDKMLHFYVKIPNNSKYWDAIINFYMSAKFDNSKIINIQHSFFKDFNRDLKIIKGLEPLKIGEINKLALDNEYYLQFQKEFIPRLEKDLENTFDIPKSFSSVDLNSVSKKEFNRISVFQAIANKDDKPYSMEEIHREIAFSQEQKISPVLDLPFDLMPVNVIDTEEKLNDKNNIGKLFLGSDGVVYDCVNMNNEFVSYFAVLDEEKSAYNPVDVYKMTHKRPRKLIDENEILLNAKLLEINPETRDYIYKLNPNIDVDNIQNPDYIQLDNEQIQCVVENYSIDNSKTSDNKFDSFGHALHNVLVNSHENVKFKSSQKVDLFENINTNEIFGSSKDDNSFLTNDGEIDTQKIDEMENAILNFNDNDELDNDIDLDFGLPKSPFKSR